MQTEGSISHLSGDDIIELVKDSRNDIITKLLDNDALRAFLSENYQLENVSAVKLEFIKRALKDLSASPVDLSHYGSLILSIRRAGFMTITKAGEALFLEDITAAIRSYVM